MPKILAVDDSKLVTNNLVKLLSPKYECNAALSGQDALTQITENKPDIVLLDINMPDMDGYEVCQAIKANPDWQDILVIFVSGIDDIERKLQAYEVGGYDFVMKPFAEQELFKKVENVASIILHRKELSSAENESKNIAITSMKQASDYSYIMNFFKSMQHCQSKEEMLTLFFNAMTFFNLSASIMIDLDQPSFHSSLISDTISPIERNIYDALRDKSRLYEFGHRLMVNDKHVSFLVKNMPEDDELAGQIRDVVAAVIEGLESKIIDLKRQIGLIEITDELADTIEKVNKGVTTHNYLISSVVTDMISEMASSFHLLELDEKQEEFFTGLFERSGDKIMSVEEVLIEVQQQLSNLSEHVKALIEETSEQQDDSTLDNEPELF